MMFFYFLVYCGKYYLMFSFLYFLFLDVSLENILLISKGIPGWIMVNRSK